MIINHKNGNKRKLFLDFFLTKITNLLPGCGPIGAADVKNSLFSVIEDKEKEKQKEIEWIEKMRNIPTETELPGPAEFNSNGFKFVRENYIKEDVDEDDDETIEKAEQNFRLK